jgi:polycystin 1L2
LIFFLNQETCTTTSISNKDLQSCYEELSFFNQETQDFDLNWRALNTSTQTNSTLAEVYNAFKYTSSSKSSSFPITGSYTSYLGGGYIYKMTAKSLPNLQADFAALQQSIWIDKQTRAVVIEFSTYNVNINLFAYVTILFEIMPTGNIIGSMRVDPLNLLDNNTSAAFNLFLKFLFMFLVLFIIFKEMRTLVNMKKKAEYFTDCWVWIQWAVIVFAWAAFAMYLYKTFETDSLISKLASKTKVINLQYLSGWYEAFGYCLAFIIFLTTLNFLKMLKFNKRMGIIMYTFQKCIREMFAFGCIFFLVWISFVQLLYAMYNTRSTGFSTFIKSIETSGLMIVGKFQTDVFFNQDYIVAGACVFLGFNILIVLVLLNLFISLTNSSFYAVKCEDYEKKLTDADVFDHFIGKIKQLSCFKKDSILGDYEKYVDHLPHFAKQVDRLGKKFETVSIPFHRKNNFIQKFYFFFSLKEKQTNENYMMTEASYVKINIKNFIK